MSFNSGSEYIFLDEVDCIGNETRLVDCTHNPIGSHDCSHSEDAGIRCLLGQLIPGVWKPNNEHSDSFCVMKWS